MKVLIADDEKAARRKLRSMLTPYAHITEFFEAKDGTEAFNQIQIQQPDLVFLDIQMPGKTGLEVAMSTYHLPYHLVFVTAYDEYALQAFDTQVIDYLLKPVSQQRLKQCLDKVERLVSTSSASVATEVSSSGISNLDLQQLEQLMDRLAPGKSTKRLGVRNGAATFILETDHLAYIQSEEGFSHLYLNHRGQQTHRCPSLLSDVSLDQLILQLPTDDFLRIHRSTIVRKDQVKAFFVEGRQFYLTLLEFPNLKLPIARTKVPLVKQLWPVV